MAKTKDDDKKESELKGVERDILREIRDSVQATGASGFHYRIMKKAPTGGMSYVGHIDGQCQDLAPELLGKWKEGTYRVFCHYNDGKKIPNVPPLDYTVGDPTAAATPVVGSVSVKDIDEQITMARKERELRRAEHELKRAEKELQRMDGDEDGDKEIAAALKEFERELDKLRKENDDLKAAKKEDALRAEIADLKKLITGEDGPRGKRDPEIEALKARLAAAEATAHKAEMDALRNGFAGQINELKSALTVSQQNANTSKWTPTALAPFVPVLTAWLTKQTGGKAEAMELVGKIGDIFKSQPKGMDLKELISVAGPLITPLLTHKDNTGAVLQLVGNLVGPMVQAAAEAAANPPSGDDIGSMIQKTFGMIQKSLSDTKAIATKQAEVEKVRARAAMQIAARMPPRQIAAATGQQQQRAPQQQQAAASAQQQAQARQQPQRSQAPPPSAMTRFVGKVVQAINEQDEEYEFYAGLAEKELTAGELTIFANYKDGEMLAVYLGGVPNVDGSVFQTQYGKRWLTDFLAAFHGTPAPARPAAPKRDPMVPPISDADIERGYIEKPTPKPAGPSGLSLKPRPKVAKSGNIGSPNVVPMSKLALKPEPAAEPVTTEGAKHGNEYKYPADSVIENVEYDGMVLPVEYPSAETIAQREAERVAAVAAVTGKV